jgi:hypothetical protein
MVGPDVPVLDCRDASGLMRGATPVTVDEGVLHDYAAVNVVSHDPNIVVVTTGLGGVDTVRDIGKDWHAGWVRRGTSTSATCAAASSCCRPTRPRVRGAKRTRLVAHAAAVRFQRGT